MNVDYFRIIVFLSFLYLLFNDMLLAELIKIGDTIEFTFKGNTFRAKILRGGLIGKCQQQSIHDKEPVSVLETTVGFSSLTAWTESCLQDLLEEYYTRYSSWKRVYHRESKRSQKPFYHDKRNVLVK